MNALKLLIADHRLVDSLFKEIEDTTPSKYPPLLAKIKGALDTHMHIEEKLFYPRLIKEGNKDLVDITREGVEEHKQMKLFLHEVAGMDAKDRQYKARVKVLIEDTRHHVKEEESDMFPMVRQQFTAEALEALGEQMQAEKTKYEKAHNITPAEPPKGTVTRLIEAAGEIVSSVLSTATSEGNKRPASKKSKSGASATPSKAATARSGAATGRASVGQKSGKAGNSTASARAKNGKTASGTATAARKNGKAGNGTANAGSKNGKSANGSASAGQKSGTRAAGKTGTTGSSGSGKSVSKQPKARSAGRTGSRPSTARP